MSTVLKQQSDRLSAGKLFPVRGKGLPCRRDQETRPAFPPPLRDGAPWTGGSGKNAGQRPPGVGRALAGGFGPRLVLIPALCCGRGDGPCHCSGEGPFVLPGGKRKRIAFPPPARNGPLQTGRSGRNRGQRPTRRVQSARRGRGGRWPGALGPRRGKDQRNAAAGAMAPAIPAVTALSPVRAGSGNATRVSPALAQRWPVDRQVREQRQASARPGGREAPARGGAGAGRGLWAPGWTRGSAALWQGRWPLPFQR